MNKKVFPSTTVLRFAGRIFTRSRLPVVIEQPVPSDMECANWIRKDATSFIKIIFNIEGRLIARSKNLSATATDNDAYVFKHHFDCLNVHKAAFRTARAEMTEIVTAVEVKDHSQAQTVVCSDALHESVLNTVLVRERLRMEGHAVLNNSRLQVGATPEDLLSAKKLSNDIAAEPEYLMRYRNHHSRLPACPPV